MNDVPSPRLPAEQDAGYLTHPFGTLTTTGECEVIKAADIAKAKAEKEEAH